MADFVDCDFNETEPANESCDIFENDEPPAKKKRGENVKYKFVEEVESSDDLKQKANVAGVTKINTQNGNVYYECKNPSCCYKWKAKKTDQFKYLVYETECGHDHENGVWGLFQILIDIYIQQQNRYCDGEWIPIECVADNAQCITNSLQQVFPGVHRRNCIAHIIRHIFDVKFGEFEIDKKTDGEIIKNEILELANHAFENHFDIAGAALIAKWKESDHVGIVEFADYFDRQYIKKNKYWFAANGQGIRQNNGMEGSNKWIKRDFINRRLPLMEAIAALKKWLYVCAHKNYGDPAVSVKSNEWIAAHDLKHVTKVIFSGGTWYVRRSKSQWNDADYRDYLEYYGNENNDFDAADIELFQQNIAAVTRSTLYDNEFTCNCPIGALRMRCKHVLLIQIICNHRQWPNMPALRQTINATARNRQGRPRNHAPALSRT